MKKVLFSAFAFLSAVYAFAQAPEGINYQAVARDVSGAEMPNTPCVVQVQILNSSLGVIYQEDHTTTTNAFGLFNLVIGQGQNPTSQFSSINWAASPLYLKIYVDANGSGLVDMGYTQLWSVPYALYARQSANGPQGLPGISCWDTDGDGLNDPTEDVNGDLLWNTLDCKGDSGVMGATGPAGAQGVQGVQGATGAQGSGIDSIIGNASGTITIYYGAASTTTGSLIGATGATGAQGDGIVSITDNGNGTLTITYGVAGSLTTGSLYGPTGATGAAGPTGAQGMTGANGATGLTGVQGPTGPAGSIGATGVTGATGANGATGAVGPSGNTGPTGPAGSTGATGVAGATGANGVTGAAGPSGNTGPAGPVGATGVTGPNGANGATGPTGTTGVAGPTGSNGATGVAGPSGSNGIAGATGPTGPSGANGFSGATGPTGPSGANGISGANGATGPTGANGIAGATGPTGPTWTLSTLAYNGLGQLSLNGTAGSGGPIATTSGAWLTTGNTATTIATHFIGTTDPVDFVIRTSNSPRIQVGSSGNVGIGVATPGVKLGVWGNGTTSATASFEVKNNLGTSMFYIRDDMKIGVGNTSPTARFEIWGTGTSATTSSLFVRDNSGNPVLFASDDRKVTIGSTSNNGGRFEIWGFGNTSTTSALNVVNTSGTSMLMVRDDGRVGIGTTTPSAALTVGADKFLVSSAEGDLTFTDANASITFPATSAGSPPMIYLFATGTGNPARMVLGHSPGFPDWGLMYDDATDKFLFTNSGGAGAALTVDIGGSAVGINNTNPTNALDVNGTTSTMGFIMQPGAANGKVMTSDVSGNGTWQYPLSPAKYGELNSAYPTNNSGQYSYTPLIMTVAPQASGLLVLQGIVDYNYSSALNSQCEWGWYVSTSPVVPNGSTPFTSNTSFSGYAAAEGTAFTTQQVPLSHSIAVTAGLTYYIYIGMLDGGNATQTGANMVHPRVVATLHTTSGL